MIKKNKTVFETPDGMEHTTREAGQAHELAIMLTDLKPGAVQAEIADYLISRAALVISIIRSTGRKPRTAKASKAPKAKPASKAKEGV